jgi:protein-S-isoprenylcysteine O-methyltransferase Ste14
MAADIEHRGSLRSSTAAAMWTAYTAHAALTGWFLSGRRFTLPIPPEPAAPVAGSALAIGGLALCLAGMTRFTGVNEVTGTRNQTLLTTGIYRYSRNPQYLGYVMALTGAGLSRRSGAALVSAAALALAYSAWIPVEEAHLTRLHGSCYTDYALQTSRWWGLRG